jgi:small GTP-binding protein
MTIGVNFHSISLVEVVSEVTTNIDLSVWDFGGQERFRPLLPKMLTGSNGAMLVFDLTSLLSVKKLAEWHAMLSEKGAKIPYIVVGTKKDIVDMDPLRRVKQDFIEEILTKIGNPPYYETSSKLGINTEVAFNALVQEIIKKYEKENTGIF